MSQCFTTNIVVWREVKKFFSEAFDKHWPFLLWFSFYEYFNRQFTYAVFFIFKTVDGFK